jgi:hypothetical protein
MGRLTLGVTLAFAARGTTSANEGKAVAEGFKVVEGSTVSTAAEPETIPTPPVSPTENRAASEMEAVGATLVPKNKDPMEEILGVTLVLIVEGPAAVEMEIVGTNLEMEMGGTTAKNPQRQNAKATGERLSKQTFDLRPL